MTKQLITAEDTASDSEPASDGGCSGPAPVAACGIERTPVADRLDRTGHVILLTLSASVVLLSLMMSVRNQEQVLLPVVGVPLPPLCTFKRAFGWDCPGCGLTRCFISLAHGDLSRAWEFNPAGVYFFGLVASQIPFRSWQLWRLRGGRSAVHLGWWGHGLLMMFVLLLLGQWLVRLTDRWL